MTEIQKKPELMNKPLTTICFLCKKPIIIKYCRSTHQYAQKNNWGYWTKPEINKNYWICDNCLFNLYHQHKWEFQKLVLKTKQNLFRNYLASGKIKGKITKFMEVKPEAKKT